MSVFQSMIVWKWLTLGFYIKCNEGERERTTGETERENHSIWYQYKVQKDYYRKTEWGFQRDKRYDVGNSYHSQDHMSERFILSRIVV